MGTTSKRPGTVLYVIRDRQGRTVFEVTRHTRPLRADEYRYRILGGNGEIMASGEAYPSASGAMDGAHALLARLDPIPSPVGWHRPDNEDRWT